MKKPVPLLFLDIDSTVRKGFDEVGHFINKPSDVEVFPEAVEQMRRWRRDGGRIVGISNQGGIAQGKVSEAMVALTMLETRAQCASMFDEVLWCPHYPDFTGPCWCRKPDIGNLIIAERRLQIQHPHEEYPHGSMLFVGDRPEDEKCAERAGIAFKWANIWRMQGRIGSAKAGQPGKP